MRRPDLCIYFSYVCDMPALHNTVFYQFEEIVRMAKNKSIIGQVFKYKNLFFFTPNFNAFPQPFLTSVICRLLAVGRIRWIDSNNVVRKIGVYRILSEFIVFLKENLTYRGVLKNINKELDSLLVIEKGEVCLDTKAQPIYLRCDYSYGYIAGGSVGHIAGVLNQFGSQFDKSPIFVSSDKIPTVRDDLQTVIINTNTKYRNVRDIANMLYSNAFYNETKKALDGKDISIIYQRNALNSYAGVKLAMNFRVPFVLEYNGSDVWTAINWGGRTPKAPDISLKIEDMAFQKADLIVCVSQPLKDELICRGIDAKKILVNPNGVNESMYHPGLDGTFIREMYNIGSSTVLVGFIGTFGIWHGIEILAQAFSMVIKDGMQNTKLMLIGDGLKMPLVRTILSDQGVENKCVLTGMIPQKEGPAYLSACDILVSPQVKNPDGTPFFGSPTKLFEYMAMGKAIIASDLDQIGEVLEHEKTALLCQPGDVPGLCDAIKRLIGDAELRSLLGRNARKEVTEKYTWELHVKKTMDYLKRILSTEES